MLWRPFQLPAGLADGLGVERSPSIETIDLPLPDALYLLEVPDVAGHKSPRWVPRAPPLGRA